MTKEPGASGFGGANFFQATKPAESAAFDLSKVTADFNKQSAGWPIQEAYLCLLLTASFADGDVAPIERDILDILVRRSRVLKQLSPQQLAEANASINVRLSTRANGLEEACGSLPKEMRMAVFAHCVDIILADGELLQVEADLLGKLVTMMELPPAEAQRVVETLLMKSKF